MTILKNGNSYIIEQESTYQSIDIFKKYNENTILFISRENPKKLLSKTNENKKIIWLTNITGFENTVKPNDIEQLGYDIEQFMQDKKNCTILLTGIEYLTEHTSFNQVLHIIQDLKDTASMHNSILIVIIGKKTFEDRQLNLLRQELIEIKDGI